MNDDYSVAARLDKIEGLEDDVVISMSRTKAEALLAALLDAENRPASYEDGVEDYPFHGLIRALKNIL